MENKLDNIAGAGSILYLLYRHYLIKDRKVVPRTREEIALAKKVRQAKESKGTNESEPLLDSMTIDCIFIIPALLGIGKLFRLNRVLKREWRKAVQKYSERDLFRGYFIFTVMFYFGFGGSMVLVDLLRGPRALYKKKYQPETGIKWAKVPKLLFYLSINTAGPLCFAGLAQFIQSCLSKNLGSRMWELMEKIEDSPAVKRMYSVDKTVPSLLSLWRDSMIFLALYEVGGYYTHRMFHIPFLYKTVHKTHHEWTSPIAVTAAYAHPIEYSVSNVGPALVASLILKPHILTLSTYSVLGMIITLSIHSGYGFFGDEWVSHDIHHETFRNNYGFLSILDKLHGTYTPTR